MSTSRKYRCLKDRLKTVLPLMHEFFVAFLMFHAYIRCQTVFQFIWPQKILRIAPLVEGITRNLLKIVVTKQPDLP